MVPGRFDPLRLPAVWREALEGCLPARLRERPRMRLRREADGWRLWLRRAGEEHLLGEAAPTDPGTLGRLLASGGKGVERVLELPADRVLIRRATFPSQVRANLDSVLGYEIERLTPFSRDALYFAWRLAERQPHDRLAVEIAVVPRGVVDPWLRELREAGAPWPVRLTWEGAWAGADLLPALRRGGGGRARRWSGALAWALILGLSAMVLATPLWQKRQVVLALGEQLQRARKQAVEVSDLRRRLEQATRSAHALLDRKRSTPSVTRLLQRLTELVPDDSWVSYLDVRKGKVQLRGESPQAAALVERLARQPGFRNVAFRSPVVQIPNSTRERFHIVFDYGEGHE